MNRLDTIAGLLFAEDPRQQAGRILGHLVAESGARGGAVLAIDGAALVPVATHGVSLDGLVALNGLWKEGRGEATSGHRADDGALLVPLREDGAGEAVGVLYLDGPSELDDDPEDPLRLLLAKAIRAEGGLTPAVADFLTETSAADAQRAQLLAALEKHEWNIAEVARLLGITRRTVYLRLQRYGIQRKKVPKTLKKAPVW